MRILTGIVSLILCFYMFYVINRLGREASDINDTLKEYVGKKIIIEGDTLLITDYSFLNSTLRLKNGTEIGIDLVKKSKVIN